MGERRTREVSRDPSDLLRDLALLLREPGRTLEDDLQDISRVAAEGLGVTRASVWLFDDEQTVLECANQFEREHGLHTSGQRLVAERYPNYFAACADVQALAVENVHEDPRVVELAGYFEDSGIEAMLDAPVFVGAVPLGVVCHEDTAPRAWTAPERAFAGAIAQLAANSIAACRWRAREDALRRSEALYRSIVEDFTDFGVRSAPDGRILDINRAAGVARGTDPSALKGLTVFDMAPPEEHHIFVDAARRCTPQSPVVRYTHHVVDGDGAWRLIDWTSRAFFDPTGKLTGYQAIGRDVTEQRRQEASLRGPTPRGARAVLRGHGPRPQQPAHPGAGPQRRRRGQPAARAARGRRPARGHQGRPASTRPGAAGPAVRPPLRRAGDGPDSSRCGAARSSRGCPQRTDCA